MVITDSLKDLIKKHEGFSNHVYLCPAGKRTIGWGHNIDANPLPKHIQAYLDAWGYLLPEHCEELLESDINVAIESCERIYPFFSAATERRQNALVDFCFNVGEGTARTFKNTNRAINEGRWDDAAKGFENSKWFSQVGNRSREIVSMIREG